MPKNKDTSRVERGPKINEPVCIGEEVKIGINLALQRFRLDPSEKELPFPSSLSTTERAYVHRVCSDLGSLKTWSRGNGQSRYITVMKTDDSKSCDFEQSVFTLVNCAPHVTKLMQTYPITPKEQHALLPQSQKSDKGREDQKDKAGFAGIARSPPQIPLQSNGSDLMQFRQSLPVYKMKDEILEASEANQVILVAGETGSGKTTQVPQLILETYSEKKKACRILCTQPRRLAAVSVSERIACERGERIGHTVGYQIRLESKVSPNTMLTFCTTGVLLRALMGGTSFLEHVTHIIVDEVHERDKFTDFLLLCLKEALPSQKHLRVILMSATLNMDLFSGYYDNCPVVCVPGNLFPVDEYFLEDILKWTRYKNKKMKSGALYKDRSKTQEKKLNEWCSKEMMPPTPSACHGTEEESEVTISDNPELEEEQEDLEPWVVEEMGRLMQEVWLTGNEDLFSQILYLISSENISVDHIHVETSVTPLMIAAGRGFVSIVEHLLNFGANVNLKTSNDWTALDFARKFQQNDVVDLLEAHSATVQEDIKFEDDLDLISAEDKELLALYQQSFDDEKVDIDLVINLIYKLYSSSEKGAILVFLPGYDEIISLKTCITEDAKFDPSRYVIYVLHSSLQHSDQKRVFKNPPHGVRKIVLSTNIAETSITINDIVFVVDCGKVKEKTFDALTSLTMLKSNWISKASGLQRKGRAGRCQAGKCYHLFSRPRYLHLQDYQTPEILRLPLQELCLHTKLLAPNSDSITNFLSKCPQAPPQLVITNAVHMLKRIDALDPVEDMTELGRHLADLPIEPRLGKMVLYAVVMKCLDPVLTIVCTLAFKDPFVLPSLPSQKRAVMAKRKMFAEETFSDHMVLLRAFQAWQKAKTEGWERPFCEKNFVSSATMEMLTGMRQQVIGQLKTSGFLRNRGPGDARDLNSNSNNWAVVKACLVAGTYPSLIQRAEEPVLCTEKEPNVRFHNSSVLQQMSSITNIKSVNQWRKYVKTLPSKWMIYEEMTRINRVALAKCVSLVSPMAVFLCAGPGRLGPDALKEPPATPPPDDNCDDVSRPDDMEEAPQRRKHPCIQLDEWLTFQMENAQVALMSVQLRMKWHSLFLSRMKNPHQPWSQSDEAVLRVVITLLTSAEKEMSMNNPMSVGQRPRTAGGYDELTRPNGGGVGSPYQPPFLQQYSGNHHHPHHNPHHNPHHHHHPQHQLHHQSFPRPQTAHRMFASNQQRNNNNYNRPRFDSPNSQPGNKASPDQQRHGSGHNSEMRPDETESHYFIMKSNNLRNLDLSQAKSLWATCTANQAKMDRAFLSGKRVYLVFSVQGSGHFQGFARMISTVNTDQRADFGGPGMSGTFAVHWEKRANMPFPMTHHLSNPWNDNKLLQNSRDGQAVEPSVGAALIRLWGQLAGHPNKQRPQSGWNRGRNHHHGQARHRGHNSYHARGGKPNTN